MMQMQEGQVNPAYDDTVVSAPPMAAAYNDTVVSAPPMAAAPMGVGACGPAPGTIVWMPKPEPMLGVPPGLEYLSTVDQLLVHQEVELLEALTGWESKNKYSVKNSMGQGVYYALEDGAAECQRQFCGDHRGFTMHITDNFGQEVIRVIREFHCCVGCCWCATSSSGAYEIKVEAPPGQVVGYVRQGCSFWTPKIHVMDANREIMFDIAGPCCICDGCCGDEDFLLNSTQTGEEVGKISKQWSGLVKEIFTKADNFGISFPINLDVRMKAVLLGGVFLIDFMFFEDDDDCEN